MQVFVPYKNVIDTAKAMWADSRRYNKAIIELKQIIAAIEGAKAWRNHPACLCIKSIKIGLYAMRTALQVIVTI